MESLPKKVPKPKKHNGSKVEDLASMRHSRASHGQPPMRQLDRRMGHYKK